MKSVSIIDTSWFVHRCVSSPRSAEVSKYVGDPLAGPTFTLLNSLPKLYREFPNPIFVSEGKPSRKLGIYPQYKSNRTHDEESSSMRQYLREMLADHLPTVFVSCEGEEADDVIATVASRADCPVRILSADKDLWQLRDEQIDVYTVGTYTGKYAIVTGLIS